MFQISDLPELVSDFASGDVDWMIAYSVLLRLLGDHDVSEVMAGLSPELAVRFEGSLKEEFEGVTDPSTVVWVDNAGGDPPNRDVIITRIMDWLKLRADAQA